jgi:plastocyanin
MPRRTVATPCAAALFGVAAVLAAPSAGAQEPTAEAAGKMAEQSVLVKLKAGTLGFDTAEVKAGQVSFRIENTGNDPHGFRVQGPDTDWRSEQLILPQEARTIALDLKPGTYTLTCPLEDHAAEGMKATLTVTE